MSGHASGRLSCSHGLHSGDGRKVNEGTWYTGQCTLKHKALLTSVVSSVFSN